MMNGYTMTNGGTTSAGNPPGGRRTAPLWRALAGTAALALLAPTVVAQPVQLDARATSAGTLTATSAQLSASGARGLLSGLLASACNACEPELRKALQEMQKLVDLSADLTTERLAAIRTRGDVARQRQRVAELFAKKGDFAESVDPRTGNKVRSEGIGNGLIEVTVTDANGKVLSSRRYKRPSLAAAERKLAELESRLAELDARAEALAKQVKVQEKAVDTAIAAYIACLMRCALVVNSRVGGGEHVSPQVYAAMDAAVSRHFSGTPMVLGADLNADGINDTIRLAPDGEVLARISRDGEVGTVIGLGKVVGGARIETGPSDFGDASTVRIIDDFDGSSQGFEVLDGDNTPLPIEDDDLPSGNLIRDFNEQRDRFELGSGLTR